MQLFKLILLVIMTYSFTACNNTDKTTQEVTPETLGKFMQNLDDVTLQSRENIQTWYQASVPGVHKSKRNRIAKKKGRFLALIDALPASAKVIPTTGSRVESSYDGLYWEDMNVELPGGYIAIIATPQYFYAVGHSLADRNKGSIIRSIDGFSWEEVLVSEHQFSDIEQGNEVIVAVGYNGQVASSTNGLNWKTSIIGNYSLYDVVYGENFLSVADPYAIFSLKDAVTLNLIKHDIEAIGLRNALYHNGLYLFFSYNFVLRYDGENFFAPLKKTSQLTEVIYKNQFMSLDKDVLVSDDGVTWTKIAELEVVDENTTGLNSAYSFISGSSIIFTQKY